MIYIYSELDPFYYEDTLIAKTNDVIELIDKHTIKNKTRNLTHINLTEGIVSCLINSCKLMELQDINPELINRLIKLGIIPTKDSCRNHNIGSSNYSEHIIQPWSIWLDWDLNPWDADIIKRVLRTKEGSSRTEDYEKIIHICEERIRQLKNN